MEKPFKIIKETEKEARKTTVTLILGGFGLVAALAWNDAIQTFFNLFLPKTGGLVGKFFYALLITFLVVVISSRLKKISETEQENILDDK